VSGDEPIGDVIQVIADDLRLQIEEFSCENPEGKRDGRRGVAFCPYLDYVYI
jgi:hypothetical protein